MENTDKKGGKDTPGGDGKVGGLSKLKDPNQAHEKLDVAKNVP